MNRSAQVHLGVTIGSIGLLLAGIHFFGRYDTLLTDQVNMFQKSVVHGLSYTDNFVNIPKAYVLAAVAIIAAIWVLDRKSTRLNSSHVAISYAVFCLKQKMKSVALYFYLQT